MIKIQKNQSVKMKGSTKFLFFIVAGAILLALLLFFLFLSKKEGFEMLEEKFAKLKDIFSLFSFRKI